MKCMAANGQPEPCGPANLDRAGWGRGFFWGAEDRDFFLGGRGPGPWMGPHCFRLRAASARFRKLG